MSVAEVVGDDEPSVRSPGPIEPDGEPPRRTSRRELGPRSLTARLITGVVALVLVLVALIGGGTWFALRSFLDERLDQQLTTTAGGSLDQLFDAPRGFDPGVRRPLEVYAVALRLTGSAVQYPSNGAALALRLSDADRTRLLAMTPSSITSVRTIGGESLRATTRVVQVQLRANPQVQFSVVVVVGLSTAEEHRTLQRLVALELIIGAAAVALALLATSLGVRFSLRRLRQVTDTAQEVAAELSPTGAGLERRVDVPDDGSEVGQLAESMNTLLSAVELQFAARLASEARMRQFLADASHELRTPLTSIRGYAELARMQKAAGADSEDNLARIESEGTRMSRLVEDLLMLARDERSEAEPRQELVDLAEVVDDVVSSSRAAFLDRRIDVALTGGLHVIGDHDQLVRAARNLVANAALHTAPGRPILVRCAHAGEVNIIEVSDGGPGLPPEEAAHVFERFWRADKARSRSRGGSGLGLSIVASIVAAHGGSVGFDSSVERGSTVTVSLPAVDG